MNKYELSEDGKKFVLTEEATRIENSVEATQRLFDWVGAGL